MAVLTESGNMKSVLAWSVVIDLENLAGNTAAA
jgi:hypothetical protein